MCLPPTHPISGLDTARLDELRDLDPGDSTYLDRAISNFERNSEALPAQVREHIAAGDAAALRAVSHKLLGSALNLGAVVAVEPLRALEEIGDQHTTVGAAELVPTVEGVLRKARELLGVYRSTYTAMMTEADGAQQR